MDSFAKLDRIIELAQGVRTAIQDTPLSREEALVVEATLDDAQVTLEGLDEYVFGED